MSGVATNPPKTLAELISLAESNNNPHAVRYEQWFHPSRAAIDNCKKSNGGAICTDQTAQEICKFSYGEFQIMGGTLYELTYHDSIFNFMNSSENQYDMFIEFISSRKIDYSLFDILHNPSHMYNFAHHYNGDAATYTAHLFDVFKRAGGVL